jgi:hypothetical protein
MLKKPPDAHRLAPKDAVVVSGEKSRRMKGHPTGQALVKLLQDSPLGDVDIERAYTRSRVRDVELFATDG